MPDRPLPAPSDLLSDARVSAARSHVLETDDRTLADQVELTRIPAPPFGEGPRARRMAALLAEQGARDVAVDRVGNVVGRLEGGGEGPPLVLSAHLDTVFPEGTTIEVRREEGRIVGPGISDDGRGLAALLGVTRALTTARVPLGAPLLLAATVGEEGVGDLRGVKHLFGPGGRGRDAVGFVSLDGAGLRRIVTRGVGSRRLRVEVRGPGGHSWVDWGTPNPIHALGTAVAGIQELGLSTSPRTTVTVARWAGGTSVNAIPGRAWIELDLRSESQAHLAELEERVRRAVEAAVGSVNARGESGREKLRLQVETIGDRPAGRTDPEAALVRAAIGATRAVGVDPDLVASSTDANLPMSLGIPAITLGAGGEAGRAHTEEEWYTNERGADGIVRALLTIVTVAGLEPS